MAESQIKQQSDLQLLKSNGKSIPLRPGNMVRLGRAPENEIILSGHGVSSQHAKIEFDRTGPRLFDRGSKNGTAINGIRVPPAGSVLRPGDRIQIGDAELLVAPVVHSEPSPPQATASLEHDVTQRPGPSSDTILCFSRESSGHQPISVDDPEYLLALLMRSASLATEVQDPKAFLRRFLDLALEAIPAQRGAVFLGSAGGAVPAQFQDFESRSETSFSVSTSALSSALDSGRPVLISDCEAALPSRSLMKFGVSSVVCVPICSGARVVGALYLDGARAVPSLTRRHLELAAALATQVGIIWENRRLMTEAVQSDRFATIGLVASEVAHDLANYFTALRFIQAEIERAVTARPEDQDLAESWTAMKQALGKSYAVVADLQSMSKKRDPVWSIASPASTVTSAAALCQKVASAGSVHLRIAPAPEGIAAFYDAAWMERALVNLVKNAIEASPAGTEVALGFDLDRERGLLVFTVADVGRGIPLEDQSRVLEPFFTSGKPKGTGIGLAFAHRIAVAHGGSLTFSTKAGQGTVFTLSIPARTSRPIPGNDGATAKET